MKVISYWQPKLMISCMNNSEKIYTSLCILFISLIILGNLIYQKFIHLQLPFHQFQLSAGAMLYPLTFLITALITEFYGKEKAQFCITLSIFINILIVIMITFMDYLPATEWSKIDDATFHRMFGYYGVAFIGSIVACYISQAVDVRLYLMLRTLTQGKYLWLRSNGSTCISLFIDTFIIIGAMTAFGIFSSDHLWELIADSYSWKLFFSICCTPLFYIGFASIKNLCHLDKTH